MKIAPPKQTKPASILWILLMMVLFGGCEEPMDKQVVYQVTGSVSPVYLKYRNEAGNMVSGTFDASSKEDEWRY